MAFRNRMQGKPTQILAADSCILLWRRLEDGIVGINQCAEPRSVSVDTRFRFQWNHPYRESLTGSMPPEIKGPIYTFQLPARTAILWMAQ
jgi:alpha-amylase